MITKVRELAGSDPATVSALIGLLKTADPEQAASIGTALGQVAIKEDPHCGRDCSVPRAFGLPRSAIRRRAASTGDQSVAIRSVFAPAIWIYWALETILLPPF